jgi:hypothetical protein
MLEEKSRHLKELVMQKTQILLFGHSNEKMGVGLPAPSSVFENVKVDAAGSQLVVMSGINYLMHVDNSTGFDREYSRRIHHHLSSCIIIGAAAAGKI